MNAAEPRGPNVLFAGLCIDCGHATTRRDATGQPQCERCDGYDERLFDED